MGGQSNYAPPTYIPIGESDIDTDVVQNNSPVRQIVNNDVPVQWSSGICACCDDMQSCCVGLLCPCFIFGKNAEFLGSGTFVGPCTTHFILLALVNTFCCLATNGVLLGLPGCLVTCYTHGYRKKLRSKYNLPEAPCGDFMTHFFCYYCAICQEYREIRERSGGANLSDYNLVAVTAPPIQIMDSESSH